MSEIEMTCLTNQGIQIQGRVLRLTRHLMVFEIHDPGFVLQTSEVLTGLQVGLKDRKLYSGQAVVANLVNTGAVLVCEAALDQTAFDPGFESPRLDPARLEAGFGEFMRDWGKYYRIRPAFKVICADLHHFLADLRLWLEGVGLGMRSLPESERVQVEREAARHLSASATPALCELFAKFEEEARNIEKDMRPAHGAFCRRQLHPLLLCSPFMNRIYTKPLGYAGDYKMVDMILGDPLEGGSVFAMLLNVFILSQTTAVAHRNRVSFLTQTLVEETNRVAQQNRVARIFNVGCGPAGETQEFLRTHALADHAHFTLLDMNDETLAYVGGVLRDIKMRSQRNTGLKLIKKSVHQLLKANGKPTDGREKYDLIYCAGLFDYLNDPVCRGLMNLFYDLLAPGGKLVATNVDTCNPIRNIMEYVFEWYLIHRTGRQLAALAPERAPREAVSVSAEGTSSNIFIEVRKPRVNS